MRFLILFLTTVVFISCKEKQSVRSIGDTTFDVKLLVGNWIRTNDSGVKQTFESWRLGSNSFAIGEGYTMSTNDTIWKESLSIEMVEGYKNLVVKDSKGQKTFFKFVDETNASFKCHSPTNDYPKFIEYKVSKDKINAVISDGEHAIDFNFIRVND